MQGIESIKASLEKNIEVFEDQKVKMKEELAHTQERLDMLKNREKEIDSKIKTTKEEIEKIKRFEQWDLSEQNKNKDTKKNTKNQESVKVEVEEKEL